MELTIEVLLYVLQRFRNLNYKRRGSLNFKQFGGGAIDTKNHIPVGSGTELNALIYAFQLLSDRRKYADKIHSCDKS